MKKWILYVFILGFAVYWASNLLLWFPWSYSTELGITLMLTVGPLIWAFITFQALKTFPGSNLMKGASIVAIVFLFLAVIMDYVFFGIIRNAMVELYHPTTLYGYGFLLALPFILVLISSKKILQRKRNTTNLDIIKAGLGGIVCFGVLALIIILRIEF